MQQTIRVLSQNTYVRCGYNSIMNSKLMIENLSDEKFYAQFGVHKAEFDAMLTVLENAYKEARKKGGRKRKLSIPNILIVLLSYYRDDSTMESLAFKYGVRKQRISQAISWAEQTLFENNSFVMPSKRESTDNDTLISMRTGGTKKMQDDLDLIEESPVFKGIEPDSLKKILDCMAMKRVSYKKDEIIMNAGDKADYVYVLLKGNVRAVTHDFDGFESIVWEISSPMTFNDSCVFAGLDYSGLKYLAVSDCEMLLIDSEKIKTQCLQKCSDHIQLIMNLLHFISIKAIICAYKVDILSKPSTRRKILCFFDHYRNGAKKFTIPYNRNEMALFLCVDRTGLSKELMKMKNEGLILYKRNEFEILL